MSRWSSLLRLAGAACALTLAVSLFQSPLLRRLPPEWAEEVAATLPGFGPSRGFVTQVLSMPAGAEVWIDGQRRGTTPFFGNVTCREGAEVTIDVVAPERRPWRRAVPCRQGQTLKVTARLDP